jgi:hypothetical protein
MILRDNTMFKISDTILTYLVGAFSLVLVIALPTDSYEFLKHPDDYIKIYDLDTSKGFWQYQYLCPQILIFIGAVVTLLLIFSSFKYQSNKTLLTIKQIIVFSLTGIFIYSYYQ